MANVTIKLKCKVAWWVPWYLRGCMLFAKLFNRHPDADKIIATALKGYSVEAKGEVVK